MHAQGRCSSRYHGKVHLLLQGLVLALLLVSANARRNMEEASNRRVFDKKWATFILNSPEIQELKGDDAAKKEAAEKKFREKTLGELYPIGESQGDNESRPTDLPKEAWGVWGLEDVYDINACKTVKNGPKIAWPTGYRKNTKLDFYQLQMWVQLLSGEHPETSNKGTWADVTKSFDGLEADLMVRETPSAGEEDAPDGNFQSALIGERKRTGSDQPTYARFIYSATETARILQVMYEEISRLRDVVGDRDERRRRLGADRLVWEQQRAQARKQMS
jgi:hypothetical protein